jgi:hypothetical protein
MTETNAAQADPLDAFVQEAIDQDSNENEQESQPIESATITETKEEVTPVEAEAKPEHDGTQKRFNKLTAEKYELKRQLDEYKAKEAAPVEPVKAPTLEAHDYDEEAYNKSNVEYLVQQEMGKQKQAQQQVNRQVESQKVQAAFNEQAAALGKGDFGEKAEAVPQLPVGVADAIMQSENGAEIVYHLGGHLDQADALAGMTTSQALMEIGRMSLSLNKKPEIKLSAAPEPIEPLRAGSAITSDVGGDMSIESWMAKYN